ncbi:hypothetical protein P7C73_g3429, partial [Tremellales sp. Uapishka_1]
MEYGTQCWCGAFLSNSAALSKTATCAVPCAGNSLEICGGYYALSLYVSTKSNAAALSADLTAVSITLPSGWSTASATCIAEGSSGRALVGASYSSTNMTVPNCLNFCATKGLALAGVEYGKECYCGNALVNGASMATNLTSCGMVCSGDSTTNCGGYGALQLYTNPAYAFSNVIYNNYVKAACLQEVVGRALRGASFSDPAMTPSLCTSYCAARGFNYAAVEYANECYCGSALVGGASLTLLSDQCYMTCAGDSSKTCGGPDALEVFVNPNVLTATVALPSGWTRQGCIAESHGGRALTYDATSLITKGTMTGEACAQQCAQAGYTMAGTEYSSQCYCGNALSGDATGAIIDTLTDSTSACNYACTGNTAQMCGGPSRLTYYTSS